MQFCLNAPRRDQYRNPKVLVIKRILDDLLAIKGLSSPDLAGVAETDFPVLDRDIRRLFRPASTMTMS